MTDDYLKLPDDWVRVMVSVPASDHEVWDAVTDPRRVAQWFGNLRTPMTPGVPNRVDFGDGDFFDVDVDHVEPGERLLFRWRFLGVGPECRVTWTLTGGAEATTLTVDDSCPGRPGAEVAQLKAGWLDFVGRLARYLETGRPARYDWRQEIDGSVVLPDGPWHPLRDETVVDWLPIAVDATGPGWFFVVDQEGPRRFTLRDWDLDRDRTLAFAVEIPGARTATHCQVRVEPAARGGTLAVSHQGWHRLGLSDLQQRTLRHRFAATWTAALGLAEECARTRQELR
ncbi:SRPBCC domain-containing protein [Micromonospora sp. NPDC018662]|uniref:SRPBCC domain-containing protein n=1 Tax=Micromonospora sp. NPDC018662 TaxID=3364238 RepID=UPI00379D2643